MNPRITKSTTAHTSKTHSRTRHLRRPLFGRPLGLCLRFHPSQDLRPLRPRFLQNSGGSLPHPARLRFGGLWFLHDLAWARLEWAHAVRGIQAHSRRAQARRDVRLRFSDVF